MTRTRFRLAPALASLLILAACGGGGGGGSPTATIPVEPDDGIGDGATPPPVDPDPTGSADPGPVDDGPNDTDPGADEAGHGVAETPPEDSTASSHPATISDQTGPITNTTAADLAVHWHEATAREPIAAALEDAGSPAVVGLGVELQRQLLAAAGASSDTVIDTLARKGTYTVGRWTAGPSDHMPVTVDWQFYRGSANPRSEARRTVERAAKRWSHWIAEELNSEQLGPETWRPGDGSTFERVTSTGAHVFVFENDEFLARLDDNAVGGAGVIVQDWDQSAGYSGRFGVIMIREDILTSGAAGSTAMHEIGHVLMDPVLRGDGEPTLPPHSDGIRAGRWFSNDWAEEFRTSWPEGVPFHLDDATGYDYKHWDARVNSVMAHHGPSADPYETAGATAIDVEYLKYLGYGTVEYSDDAAPEMYSLGAWGENSAFGITVERTLKGYRDTHDQLRAEAFATGINAPSANSGIETANGSNSASWTGLLVGADLASHDLRPVTGDATISVSLDTLDTLRAKVQFTNLTVFDKGEPKPFRKPGLMLEYDGMEVKGNSFTSPGNDLNGRIRGTWYGESHEEVTGSLLDTREDVNLIAAYGGSRPEK